ncbi:hypothetical protein HAX54_049948 [Datura stramonium]|uniref:Uncharacterized protein n=1 Tax=Datura stramonium TaxID=4076 RepID=A0ABS8SXJ5_DATST|nr:hypothetical protein [Datura stramonium]
MLQVLVVTRLMGAGNSCHVVRKEFPVPLLVQPVAVTVISIEGKWKLKLPQTVPSLVKSKFKTSLQLHTIFGVVRVKSEGCLGTKGKACFFLVFDVQFLGVFI